MKCLRLLPLSVFMLWWKAQPALAGGGVSLWQLGDEVDKNPITVFSMFVLTVLFTVIIEVGKHGIEHRTYDPHRRKALEAIYSELMLMGLVAFLLILGAELGLTKITIKKPGCDSGSASGSGAAEAGSGTTGSGSGSTSLVCSWRVGDGYECNATGDCADVVKSNVTYSCYPAAPVPAPDVTTSGSAGSGSGSDDPCLIGFDLLMFEYAHLVLFFMGITYALFIQVAFWQRDRAVNHIKEAQKKPLAIHINERGGFRKPSIGAIMGLGGGKGWAESVIMLRNIMILRCEDRIGDACDRGEAALMKAYAIYRGKPIPAPLPPPEDSPHHFDMARLTHIAVSEVMVELLHVPPFVWFCVVGMSATNLIHMMDVSLAEVTLLFAPFGLLLSLFQGFFMAKDMRSVLLRGCGHHRFFGVEHHEALALKYTETKAAIPPQWVEKAKKWENDPSHHPWRDMDGCCDDDSFFNACDPLDAHALEVQMQVTIFVCCFYIGQMTMLSTLIVNQTNVAVCIACWLLPLVPLGMTIPRCILVYSLVHRTHSPPRHWLQYALKAHDDPPDGHGHGHAHGHGHLDPEDEEVADMATPDRRQYAVKNLMTVLASEKLLPEGGYDGGNTKDVELTEEPQLSPMKEAPLLFTNNSVPTDTMRQPLLVEELAPQRMHDAAGRGSFNRMLSGGSDCDPCDPRDSMSAQSRVSALRQNTYVHTPRMATPVGRQSSTDPLSIDPNNPFRKRRDRRQQVLAKGSTATPRTRRQSTTGMQTLTSPHARHRSGLHHNASDQMSSRSPSPC
eukprot:Hpha_TRINITY_DN16920_c2_g7::TRINITY_DN16920_c2_g7_i1::g.52493::m.52493